MVGNSLVGKIGFIVGLIAAVLAPTHSVDAQTDPSTEVNVAAFLAGGDRGARAQATADVLTSGATFREIYELLQDPPHPDQVAQTGRIEIETDVGLRNGTVFRALLVVPQSYDRNRSYPVRFYLHGGVQRGEWQTGDSWWRRVDLLEREDVISVFPAAWSAHPWWRWSQVRHLQLLLERIKMDYNADENRVSLFGVSDGGTGAYYMASHWSTPWASFLPFISHPAVLANPGVAPDGATFPIAMKNKPLFVVSGNEDRLYPSTSVKPYIAEFTELGISIDYRGLPGVGHELSWWPKESVNIEAFIDANPRVPHPEEIWWTVDSPGRYGRAHWLQINTLGDGTNETDFSRSQLMPTQGRTGSIHVTRRGNHFEVATQGVSRFTLLLSPDIVDLEAPIRVTVNGDVIHDGMVEASLRTLLKWAEQDRDKTMLYGAELTLSVP